jgi:hypothetical protein
LTANRMLAAGSIEGRYCVNGDTAVALVLGSLYQAWVAAGAPPGLARQAAEEVAGGPGRLCNLQRDLLILKWALAFAIWVGVGTFCRQWQTLCIIDRIEARLTSIEQSLTLTADS